MYDYVCTSAFECVCWMHACRKAVHADNMIDMCVLDWVGFQ